MKQNLMKCKSMDDSVFRV